MIATRSIKGKRSSFKEHHIELCLVAARLLRSCKEKTEELWKAGELSSKSEENSNVFHFYFSMIHFWVENTPTNPLFFPVSVSRARAALQLPTFDNLVDK